MPEFPISPETNGRLEAAIREALDKLGFSARYRVCHREGASNCSSLQEAHHFSADREGSHIEARFVTDWRPVEGGQRQLAETFIGRAAKIRDTMDRIGYSQDQIDARIETLRSASDRVDSEPSEHVDARVAVGLSRIGPTSGHVHRLSETDRLANDLCGDAFKVLRDLVEAHDAWQVNSYPSGGAPRGAAQAWFAEAQAVENVVERARSLVETGPSATSEGEPNA